MIESALPTTITNFSVPRDRYQLATADRVIGEPTFAFIMLNTIVPPTDDLRSAKPWPRA